MLTSKHLEREFEDVQHNDLYDVDHLKAFQGDKHGELVPKSVSTMDPAVLMLTSGSSGNAKAVVLSHKQIVSSVSAKSAFFRHNRCRHLPELDWLRPRGKLG